MTILQSSHKLLQKYEFMQLVLSAATLEISKSYRKMAFSSGFAIGNPDLNQTGEIGLMSFNSGGVHQNMTLRIQPILKQLLARHYCHPPQPQTLQIGNPGFRGILRRQ